MRRCNGVVETVLIWSMEPLCRLPLFLIPPPPLFSTEPHNPEAKSFQEQKSPTVTLSCGLGVPRNTRCVFPYVDW